MCRSTHANGRLASVGLAVVVSVGACGGATPSLFDEGPAPRETDDAVGSPDEILHAEILERGGNDQTAMQLIRRLRPIWLGARGQKSLADPSATYPVVYIDDIRHGGLDTLHGIPSSEIHSVRYFSMAEATIRWGTGHPSGVINIVTGRSP